jgi:hypothetical protein
MAAYRNIGGTPQPWLTNECERKNGETESLQEAGRHPRFTSERGEEYERFLKSNRFPDRENKGECDA